MDASASETTVSYPEIISIFADVFQYTGPLTRTTSPEDISRWDSLQHIALVRELEMAFSIRLSMDEMMEIRSVADIETVLQRHGL
ncbi:acyl carrier protein [Hyphomicrobium sp. LHD-15]|uniref:acyl carrier protein n=1 Tax=Hyphomicrobium sp. LHD-15 TaxID=3072142 RepID=UPI00280C8CCD|nr:acyl carrier protein [Hyphomicrobium sp. LHD-15]MDQ8698268.1 acyl carrier protein [Hyphomicrobium sp. LHD-15]